MLTSGQNVISDYSFFDKEAIFSRLFLTGDEYQLYSLLNEAVLNETITPDLVIYLTGSPEILLSRVESRNRGQEKSVDKSFVEKLHAGYTNYFSDMNKKLDMLQININNHDFLEFPQHLDSLCHALRKHQKSTTKDRSC